MSDISPLLESKTTEVPVQIIKKKKCSNSAFTVFSSPESDHLKVISYFVFFPGLSKALLELYVMCTASKSLSVRSVSLVGKGALRGHQEEKGGKPSLCHLRHGMQV